MLCNFALSRAGLLGALLWALQNSHRADRRTWASRCTQSPLRVDMLFTQKMTTKRSVKYPSALKWPCLSHCFPGELGPSEHHPRRIEGAPLVFGCSWESSKHRVESSPHFTTTPPPSRLPHSKTIVRPRQAVCAPQASVGRKEYTVYSILLLKAWPHDSK